MGIINLLQHRSQIIEKEKQDARQNKQLQKDYENEMIDKFISTTVNAIESFVLKAKREKRYSGLLRNRIDVPSSVANSEEYYYACKDFSKKLRYVRIIANQVESKHPDWSVHFSTNVKDGIRYGDGWFVHFNNL